MIELNANIKEALLEINFTERYKSLSERYDSERTSNSKRLIYIDGEEVLEILQELGYASIFDEKEKFFKIMEEEQKNYSFGANVILQDGMVDMVWVIKEKGKVILGSPLGTYSRRISKDSSRIKKPIFGTYEDLEEILRTLFSMYEDMKKALVKL